MKKNIFKCLFPLCFFIISFSSCQKNSHIDYVSEVKLTLSYEGKTFLANGIEKVTLNHGTDGDTASFNTLKDGAVSIRFLGINTPESTPTGGCEAWGKKASTYTTHYLECARHIVISSLVSLANAERAPGKSYDRYLGWVWISEVEEPTLEDFKLLNLMVLEEGYTYSGFTLDMEREINMYSSDNIGTKVKDIFNDAEAQAMSEGLRYAANKSDPSFDGICY